MNKENVYCLSCPELGEIVKNLKEEGFVSKEFNPVIEKLVEKTKFAIGYSTNDGNPGNWLGYSSNINYYKDEHNYIEVDPKTFDKLWRKPNLPKKKPLEICL